MGVSCLSCLASNEHDNFQSSVWLHVVIKTSVNRLTTESQIIYMIYCFVIALSVLLRFTTSDYPFGIFKLFLLLVGLLTLSSHRSLNICSHKKTFEFKVMKITWNDYDNFMSSDTHVKRSKENSNERSI